MVLTAHQRQAADPGVRADSEALLAHFSSVTPTKPCLCWEVREVTC